LAFRINQSATFDAIYKGYLMCDLFRLQRQKFPNMYID